MRRLLWKSSHRWMERLRSSHASCASGCKDFPRPPFGRLFCRCTAKRWTVPERGKTDDITLESRVGLVATPGVYKISVVLRTSARSGSERIEGRDEIRRAVHTFVLPAFMANIMHARVPTWMIRSFSRLLC